MKAKKFDIKTKDELILKVNELIEKSKTINDGYSKHLIITKINTLLWVLGSNKEI